MFWSPSDSCRPKSNRCTVFKARTTLFCSEHVPCSCSDSVRLVDICLILMNVAYVGESCTPLQSQASSQSLTTQSVRRPENLRALRLEKARVCIGLFHWNSSHVHEDCELSPQPFPQPTKFAFSSSFTSKLLAKVRTTELRRLAHRERINVTIMDIIKLLIPIFLRKAYCEYAVHLRHGRR